MLSVLSPVTAMLPVHSNVEMTFTGARIPVHVEETARLAVKVVSPGIVIAVIPNQVPSIWSVRNGLKLTVSYLIYCFIKFSFVKPKKAYYDRLYMECLFNCTHGDTVCVANCSRDFNSNLLQCPCQPGCPDGCPCPEYQCPSTTTPVITTTTATTTSLTTTTAAPTYTTILILNTFQTANVPVLTNSAGRDDKDFDFSMGENTEVYESCSMNFKNQHFVFGGDSERKQISQIIGCSLTRVGTLSFDHNRGACTNVANNKVYLCFGSGDYKKCRFATSPTGQYTEVQESTHEHRHTKIASSNSKSK